MTTSTDAVLEGLQNLVAEEMHLLGQELEDSLDKGQYDRLQQLCHALDDAAELLTKHRAVRRT